MGEIVELGTEAEFRAISPEEQKNLPVIKKRGEGGGFLARAGASIKMTQEGKVSFLEAVLGAGNVFTDRDGAIMIRNPKNPREIVPFDEEAVTLLDFTADLAGPAIEVAPMLAAGTNPLTVAGAAAAGNITRQGVSALLPGEDRMSILDRAQSAATTAAFAGTAQGVFNVGAKVVDALTPGNIVARSVNKALETPTGQKGTRLKEQTGIPLTLGEETGSRGILMVEGLASRMISAADEFFAFRQAQLRAAAVKLTETLDGVGAKFGDFEVGKAIIGAFDDAVAKARGIRRVQAELEFGELHKVSGGAPIIKPNNLVTEIDRIIKEFDLPGAGDAAQALVNKAKRLKDTLLAPKVEAPAGAVAPETRVIQGLSGDKSNRLLQVYTAAQGGRGVLFKEMDKQQSKFIAGRLKDAFLRDIDDAVAAGGQSAEVANALKVARDNYKANSAAINELGDSTLSRLIGNRTTSPEAIAEKFATKLAPSEVAASMAIIERQAPEAAQAIRRLFVEKAIASAREIPPSQMQIGGIRFSAARFVNALPDDKTLRAAGYTRGELVEIKRVAKVLERVSDKALEGSPTAPLLLAWDVVRGLFTMNPVTIGRSAAAIITPRKIAKASLTKEGREALITLATTSTLTKKALAAIATLEAITLNEPDGGNIRPITADVLIEGAP